MTYVSQSLCTGCGICLEACPRGAISLKGYTASIDESLCTSCGRCVDLCLTGAIILTKTSSERAADGASGCAPEMAASRGRGLCFGPGSGGARGRGGRRSRGHCVGTGGRNRMT